MSSEGGGKSWLGAWIAESWGGLAGMLVALPSAVAFGVVVFSTVGQEYAGAGALAGMLGAAALGLLAPLVGRTGGLISTPCAPAAAVLSAFALQIAAESKEAPWPPGHVFALLGLTALLGACLQIAFGLLRCGRIIKFIPYPVVSGYLSGVAVLIALGQLPKLLGLTHGTTLLKGLAHPGLWRWESLVVGAVTILLVAAGPRLTRKVPAPILGLAGGIAAYFALAMVFPRLLELQGNPLIIGPLGASGSLGQSIGHHMSGILALDLESLRRVLFPTLTLAVLLSIDTLKTCVGLDALTRTRHHSDRELVGQGLGNLASGLIGGMPGSGAMGPTLVNVASGGRTYRSGVIEGIFVILACLLLSHPMAWIPLGALAGILLVVAWRMFDKDLVRLARTPAGRLDFAIIATVILVAVCTDLITAAGVGVAFAILLFIRNQIRETIVRRKVDLSQVSSTTRRLPAEREVLKREGHRALFCELQGDLFFGTTDQLFSQLEPDLKTLRYLLFDLRRVDSLDYTAAHLFEQMNAQLREAGGRLLMSGLPSSHADQQDFERYLSELGIARSDDGVKICETMDGALEWMEDRLLEAAGLGRHPDEPPCQPKDFDLFREFDEDTIRTIAASLSERGLAPGENAFTAGQQSDELFLVRRGSVRILLPLEGGKVHHLATFGRGDFFGELAFLDKGTRSANAEAKEQTQLYVLSRARFNAESRSDPALGAQVFARLASAIANRLRLADAELRALEER